MNEAILNGGGRGLLVEITDPQVRSLTGGQGQWFVLDAPSAAETELAELADSGNADSFCRRNRGSVVVHVTTHESRAVRLDAWRGLFSQADFYYSVRPSGDVVTSDHLRNVMARIPIADRHPSERGIVEHYLTRRMTSGETIAAAITRLRHAEHLSIALGTGTIHTRVFDRFSTEIQERSREEYVDLVEAELETALKPVDGGAGVMFSGGVDSTLLMSFLKGRADAVTFVPDTPEFSAETTYAREAAKLLNVEITEVSMAEAGFLEMLVDSTRLMATPSFDDSVPYFSCLADSQPHSTWVAGQGADSAFGMSLKIARFASWFRGAGVSQALTASSKRAPGHLGYRMRQVAPLAERFRHPLMDPFGFAGSYRSSGDNPMLRSAVDDGLIATLNEEHLNYVAERIDLVADPQDSLFSHIELAHWSILLTNPMMPSHARAKAAGNVVVGPFLTPRLLETLATIPVEDRYIRRLSAKWILKDLLARRVPQYSINRRKKSSALPWQRFYERGPLTGFWDQYDVPSVFAGPVAEELVATPSATTWTAISYAVWERHVARNERLEPIPAVAAGVYEIGSGNGS